jgi:histone H1/5
MTAVTKKPAAKKDDATPKAPPQHPKYIEMVTAAISAVGGRNGASRQAILKYVVDHYKVDHHKAVVHLRLALRNNVAKGKLKMAKESGKGAGGFKIVKEEKPKGEGKPKPPVKKVKKPESSAAKSTAKASAKRGVKSPAAKKAAAKPAKKVAKTPTKKPKAKTSVKSPAAAKKAAKPAKKATKVAAKSPKPKSTKPAAKKVAPKKK